MFRRSLIAIGLVLILFGSALAQAPIWPKGQPRESKWRAFNGFAVGLNPIIFGDMLKIYRVVPITSGSHILTRDSNVRFGGATTISPLLGKIGPFVGISPLLIMDFDFYWNQYIDPVHIQFDNLEDNYATHIRNEKRVYLYHGQNFLLSSTFKMAYKNLIFVDILDFEYMWMRDTWFSIEFMTVVDDGFHFTNRMFLLYEFKPGWRAGVMWEKFYIFDSDYTRHILNFGFMADQKLPLDMTLVFLTGYHVVNPDFDGLRIWMAVIKEWDL